MESYTKQWLCAWCLFGVTTPAVAFWQKTDEPTATTESPVKVQVQGADSVLADNLKAFLPSLRNLGCNSSPERLARFIDSATTKLQEGAEAVGYYAARFNLTPARQGNCLVLNIAVQAGEPVRVTRVAVQISGEGANLPEFRTIAATPPYQRGDILVHQRYEDFKSSLSRAANNLGFFDAQYITREIRVNPDTRQAEVTLHFDTGKRYRLGNVQVEQDVLADKYVQRYVRVKEGDVYQADKLLEQQRILEGSGYYSEVIVSGRYQQAANGAVPVEIQAQRRKRYSYKGSVGYGSDTGARVGAEMETHWVNNKGHKATVRGVVSRDTQGAGITYKVPLWQPEHEYTSLDVAVLRSAQEGFTALGTGVELNYNRRSPTDWQQTVFVKYVNETLDVSGQPEVRSQLGLAGVRVKKTQRDNLLNPTQGWLLAAEVQGAQQGVISDQSLLRGKVNGKYLHTRANRDKLLLSGALGSLASQSFEELPRELRFFAGGQNSVRGYAFEGLGETNAQGAVIGGRHLIEASVEYERPVHGKWSAATFVDAGNAFNNAAAMTMQVGAGVGVRYQSPLGPIRADIAAPKDNLSDVHFYFSLGPDL